MIPGNQSFMGQTPVVTKNLLIINGLAFLANIVLPIDLNGTLGLFYPSSRFFEPYQLVTHFFMHGGFVHLLFNMYALWLFGRILEQTWGPQRFFTYYMVTALGAACFYLFVKYLGGAPDLGRPVVGASGAVYGLLLGFGMLFPNAELMLIFLPIPIKAKYFVIGFGVIELFSGISAGAGGNIAHFAHLGGMLFGIILIKWWGYHRGGGGTF